MQTLNGYARTNNSGMADQDGATAQRWIVALLHRGEERVHTSVDNLAGEREHRLAMAI